MQISDVQKVRVGGVDVARLDLVQTTTLMLDLAKAEQRAGGPWILSSVNGEVLAKCALDAEFRALVESADLISADGQPLVFASRLPGGAPLPERVATTDLYRLVARRAQEGGASFYLYGATEDVNRETYERTRRDFPGVDLRGRSHGYLSGEALDAKIDEINALAPDILWLALGVPREQEFAERYRARLSNVKMIKTSGGLFDFVAGAKKRAPQWMQSVGLEWAFRLWLEPRRLLVRYATTNPLAIFLLLTKTRSASVELTRLHQLAPILGVFGPIFARRPLILQRWNREKRL